MKKVLLYCLLLGGLTFACEQNDAVGQTEKLSPQELSQLLLADPDIIEAYSLEKQINDERSLAILDGSTLPDGPSTSILGESTDKSALAEYLDSYGFLKAEKLGELYAKRNVLLPKFKVKYKPFYDQLSEEELIELGKLLPDTRSTISATEALDKLKSN